MTGNDVSVRPIDAKVEEIVDNVDNAIDVDEKRFVEGDVVADMFGKEVVRLTEAKSFSCVQEGITHPLGGRDEILAKHLGVADWPESDGAVVLDLEPAVDVLEDDEVEDP